jgi:hypothetical protein
MAETTTADAERAGAGPGADPQGGRAIAVVGAGQMGNGIAHAFAQSGFDVVMLDVSDAALQRGRQTVEKNLERQVKKGALDAAARRDPGAPVHLDRPRGRGAGGADRRGRDRERGPQVQAVRRPRSPRAPSTSSPATPARSRSPRSPRARSAPSRSSGCTS